MTRIRLFAPPLPAALPTATWKDGVAAAGMLPSAVPAAALPCGVAVVVPRVARRSAGSGRREAA